MLPYLNADTPFPNVDDALVEPNGLLAAGADLSSERLMRAYQKGIFPWYSPGEPILWWSPDPRAVFFVDNFKIRKSVKKALKNNDLTVTLNKDFKQVIQECAAPRSDDNGTWITNEMLLAYASLHHHGHAHSVEVWQDGKLVGGIYGVATGSIFCGESMFSRISEGSKIALTCLIYYLKAHGFKLIDCQIENPHLNKLGSTLISRDVYLELLSNGQSFNPSKIMWEPKTLNWKKLLGLCDV
ncbi:leucyl/phenylalanyl-tRNA--protein transferase [Aliikangiella marina]|uniref:Leucyl/phenylalanyl-tRNA--protein transferase n=1 Tax=Aliikangiella marina TaxID=1712262 RepID=A0A545TJX0_9GAMM|nr:leucyl/phenylalanyl-tRNA--protein transferase [Aliikangiella marina]TQV77515.1 leucyl/phenylalanyl-tRNA--protein transferase [Aliikangiella marina]